MTDFSEGFTLGSGIFSILIFTLMFQTWDWPTDTQVGFTYWELAEMKKECEKSLPRDKVCKSEIKFVVEE